MKILMLARKLTDSFDRLTDSISTFRSILYILLLYLVTALFFALDGRFLFTAPELLLSAATLVGVSKLTNLGLASIFKIPANHESDLITGLILAFILSPATNLNQLLVLVAAAVTAMASKYILTLRGRNILNPAAFGAFISGTIFHEYASWWVGSRVMAPLLIVGGFLIVRKIRRFQLVLSFTALFITYQWVLAPALFGTHVPDFHLIYLSIVSTPLLFFASIMLTEPLTSPSKENNLLIFSLAVSIFYCVSKLHRPPEEALLLGNILAFALEPNRSVLLKLIDKRQEAAGIFSFIFSLPPRFSFQAGQYMEWTLPHTGIDARGNRRYLTIASAPTEPSLMFTVKIPSNHSKFKNSLLELNRGQQIAATRLAGTFTLKDNDDKVCFIAGGVGITPFRSIIKYLVDNNQERDIKVLYSVSNPNEIAFKELLEQARTIGVQTSYITANTSSAEYLHGPLDTNLLNSTVPDHKERMFYISGPQGFVASVRLSLLDLGVSAGQITTDYFPGYN